MSEYQPTKSSYKLEGFAEFEQQLLEMAKGFRSDTIARGTLAKAAGVAMQDVYHRVQATAPYDEENTGPIHLRDTVRLDYRIPTGKDRMSDYVSDTDAAIAVVSVKKSAVSLAQEFGTSKLSAKSFLRPSLEALSSQVLEKLKSELSVVIPAYAKKLARKGK